jgi:hypothetical protein
MHILRTQSAKFAQHAKYAHNQIFPCTLTTQYQYIILPPEWHDDIRHKTLKTAQIMQR